MAATLTIGSWLGRERLTKIQIGRVWIEPAVNVVTMISSKESANASSPPARRAVKLRERDVPERLPGVGAEIHRGLLDRAGGAPQPRKHVVVDDHDAERRVGDD